MTRYEIKISLFFSEDDVEIAKEKYFNVTRGISYPPDMAAVFDMKEEIPAG